MSCCVFGCVRDWEYARLGESACREIQLQHLKRNKIATMKLAKVSGKEILPLKERLIHKSLKGRTLEMKKKNHRHHKDSFSVLNYC